MVTPPQAIEMPVALNGSVTSQGMVVILVVNEPVSNLAPVKLK